ncbi:Retrovirus-related Pol polyprotein from transposon 297 [Araneus ventricosus]|uniref:Retrovirus-related Pol polyprotein from transposon 297 n=1 Tax=Araneus ventricosus TaxID=182803 RepID=A0A4Y2MHT6_ARAVE|nr:Retrovirus-related Pol polyprotein from transposon 297 [Araneus ventricosus]GBN26024.1 Retrovirus-related Pol polyprotein from transposon 297 [Araneus ventricosus]
MTTLNDIQEISTALKNCKTEKIKSLHKFLFGSLGDRSNRKRIREFIGFDFQVDSEEFKKKLEIVDELFSLNELITICNILNISFDGSKPEVSKRILSFLCNLEALAETSRADIDESDLDEETANDFEKENKKGDSFEGESSNKRDSSMQCEAQCNMQCDANKIYDMQFVDKYRSSVAQNTGINYSDIESAISKFNAESHENIANWLDHFENIFQLFSLSDLHKFIFAKRSLGGTAALFVRTEPQINSWQKLKQALIDEFSFEINSAHLHELLSKRKMRDSESAPEYFLKMKELCSSGRIEDAALMYYVIKGINDRQENKTILYRCQNLLEFKEKLKVYEVIKSDYAKRKAGFDKTKARYDSNPRFNSFDKLKPKQEHDDRFNSKNESANKVKSSGGFERMKYNNFESRKSKFCFNCGDPNHISRFCVHEDKGFKCFECGAFGHKASECDKTKSKPEVATLDVKFKPKLDNKVTIEDISVNSLIDTGSQATLLRKSVFDKLNMCKLYPLNLYLSGFGKCKVNPLGYFKGNIKIDDFKCNADIYVVENNVMSYDVIVGMNVLMQGETVIDENGIVIKEKFQRIEEVDSLSVLPIDVTPNEVELNIGPDVPNIFKDKVQQSILNYVPHKTKTTKVELNILVKSNEPISHQPLRLPFSEKKIVQTQEAEWLEQGIVEPCSSEYSSPVVIVRKKDGTPRVCIDYRKLNKVVVKDRFPLPLIEDILDRLQGSRVFSTIDLKNAFFHVDVNKDSRKYTSFVTHEGQYQFLKVPFGLCNSPAVFLKGIERVERVLRIASEYGLEINFNKSHFLKKRIEFLGHVVDDGKIFPSTLKTKAVLNFPEPANLKQIHSFLGLTGYFRKFIPNYSTIARPLSDLLKKDRKFKFREEERISFNQLKLMLAEKPVLRIYNPNYETELHTDASLEGYGAILMQKSPDDKNFHPTYYMSKKTTDAEKKYSSYELEALAVIEAVKKFRVYLLGITFKIVTDCSALEKTMQKKTWLLALHVGLYCWKNSIMSLSIVLVHG